VSGVIDLQEWLRASVEAAEEVAVSLFSSAGVEHDIDGIESGAPRSGACIPFYSRDESLQIALLSTVDGCRHLAGTLLEVDDDELPEEHIVDAIGEIVNVMAGVVKGLLIDRDRSIDFGLPVLISGNVTCSGSAERAVTSIGLSGAPIELIAWRGASRTVEAA